VAEKESASLTGLKTPTYGSGRLGVACLRQALERWGVTMIQRWRSLFLMVGLLPLCACSGPDGCGQNVAEVVSLSFKGPSRIPADPGWVGYDVSATIRKVDPKKDARLCYVVRDDDPFYKFFWAVDDVLDANFLAFSSGVDTVSREGQFLLEVQDGDVCGAGALPGTLQVKGCSGESEAEIYIQPVTEASGPTGPESSRLVVRAP
jgi:hypothetical protein